MKLRTGVPVDTKRGNLSAKSIALEMQDNGRRGEPLIGCDCVQCFGYCLVDQASTERRNGVPLEEYSE